jgi:gliding motility-associated-like protein
MRKIFFLFIFTFFTGFLSTVQAQNISNEGSDFWIPFPTHDPSAGDLANMNVFVTCKYDSEVTVSCGGFYSQTKTILANTIVAFDVPRNGSYINNTEGNSILTNRAIHVVTTIGKPNVAVYAHIYAGARSAASLILPKEALGQKYYSMNYTQDAGGRGYLVLVAVEDNTTLLIHTINGTTITITLPKAGDVYEYMPNTALDLTGTSVEVDPVSSQCKRFAAFSGSTSNTIVCNGSRDPLYQQLYSIGSWGKNYGIVPFIDRRYILRILAQEDNTNVLVNGTTIALNKGQFYESPILTAAMTVTADKLICVAQYSLTQGCSSLSAGNIIGDPEMVLLNPTEFNIKNITVFSSSNKAIQNKYVNVYMKTDKSVTFKLNGTTPTQPWTTVPSNPAYSYIQIPVFVDGLTLTADDGFNAIAYGFGNAESYAYSAGTNLASSQFLVLINKTTNSENSSTCVNQVSDFKVTLPYQIDKIVWKLGDGDPDYALNNPPFTTSVVNGETLYTYTSPVNKTFTTVGQKNIIAIATLSAAQNACSNTTDMEFNFTIKVDPLPTADFDAVAIGCSNEVITFTDKSSTNLPGKNITKWTWDFGDGSPIDNTQNPTHTYAVANNYSVKLTVGTDDGCGSMVISKDIQINPKPVALFTAKKITCIATDIAFTDKSTVASSGTITKWNWDFGDGSAINNTQNPQHSYTAAGEYTISLTVETDKGCGSIAHTEKIEITNLPTVDFSLPDVCLSDAEAVFINLSKDQDGTTATLNYSWDFGDPGSGVLNSSTQRDGRHKYAAAGVYKVILKVTNVNGCEVIKEERNFTVNGSIPIASFTVPNAPVCSNQSFTATNTSTVDFGNITRIEWYIDNALYTVDEQPTSGKSYDFNYPQFYDQPTKTITLKMVAFSGSVNGSCSNTITHNVTLKASPVVEFTTVAPMCMNDGTIQLTARDLGGLPGNGEFSGLGVSKSGLFNPLIARTGIHDITYTFLADNGCTNSVTKQIQVYQVPYVNAADDFYMLAGGEKQIEATATGSGLIYKWSPSAGLDRDDILNPIARPEFDTKYTLTVTSDQGCNQSDQVYVHVLQNVNAPNSFTPNGDGVNDVWNVKYLDTYPYATVEIYDRNGQRIYYSKGYAVPFDGMYKNQPLPVGTYYYVINPNSGRKSITGNLTIIK